MRRKNQILFALLFVTIVLIVSVRYVITKDTLKTQNDELEFFSKNIKLQKDFIFTSYQQSARIITEHLYRNPKIYEITKNSTTADSLEAQNIQNQLNTFTHPIFTQMKNMGVSYINFQIHYPFQAIPIEKSAELKQTPTIFFTLFDNFIGYKYDFPFIVDHLQVGVVEVGFDFHLIKKQLLSVNTDTEVGFLLITNPANNSEHLFKNKELQTSKLLPNFWIDHEFSLPKELLSNKKLCASILEFTRNSILNDTKNDFSFYLKGKENGMALSMSKVTNNDPNFGVFLVSTTKNQVLTKVGEINNAVYIINIIIILLAMFGIAYLVINRINILKQKVSIKKSEEKLIALNASKDKFFSIIAHDLKNPFNGIMGMSGYLNAEFDHVDDAEKKEIINDINISSKNAFNLLQNLLEWTRAQSGSIKNVPVVIYPKQIIDFSLETVANLAKNKDIEIKQIIQTSHNGFADENLVSTVIRNLATNAIKFSPRNSIIEITVSDYEKEMVFCVKDQGIGLSSEEIDKLFHIDINFHKRGTEKETGSGLGLKLCKEFVNYCNGRIWVISEPGKGSSFYFTIPLNQENETI
ncbi:MAG: sensor histidine kinase [Prolixibacteraceae bacterium]